MGKANVSKDARLAEGVAERLPALHPTRIECFGAGGQLDVFRTGRAAGISGYRVADGSDVPPLDRIARFYGDFRRSEPQIVVHFDGYDVSGSRCRCCLLGNLSDLWCQFHPQERCDPEYRLKADDRGNRYE